MTDYLSRIDGCLLKRMRGRLSLQAFRDKVMCTLCRDGSEEWVFMPTAQSIKHWEDGKAGMNPYVKRCFARAFDLWGGVCGRSDGDA